MFKQITEQKLGLAVGATAGVIVGALGLAMVIASSGITLFCG